MLTNTAGELVKSCLTFPNNYCIISVAFGCELKLEEKRIAVSENEDHYSQLTIITNYKKPIQKYYFGNVKELTVCFKPLGINHFLQNKLMSYLNDSFQIFESYPDYLQTMKVILMTDDLDKARGTIENY